MAAISPKVNCSKTQSFYWTFFIREVTHKIVLYPRAASERPKCFWISLQFLLHPNQCHKNWWISFVVTVFFIPFIWFIYNLTTFPFFVRGCVFFECNTFFSLCLSFWHTQDSFGCQIKYCMVPHCTCVRMYARTHRPLHIDLLKADGTNRIFNPWFWFWPSAMRLY